MVFVYAFISQLIAHPSIFWGAIAFYILRDVFQIAVQLKKEKRELREAQEMAGYKDGLVLTYQKRTGTKF